MHGRCTTPGTNRYDRYGGRGISVCKRWRSFENFLADMGDRPADTTLDRIDNDGNYEPSNCRWSSRIVQRNNRPRHKLTDAHVAEICGRYDSEGPTALAREFNISRRHAWSLHKQHS